MTPSLTQSLTQSLSSFPRFKLYRQYPKEHMIKEPIYFVDIGIKDVGLFKSTDKEDNDIFWVESVSLFDVEEKKKNVNASDEMSLDEVVAALDHLYHVAFTIWVPFTISSFFEPLQMCGGSENMNKAIVDVWKGMTEMFDPQAIFKSNESMIKLHSGVHDLKRQRVNKRRHESDE